MLQIGFVLQHSRRAANGSVPPFPQIEAAYFPGEDNLYCQFSIQHGNDWQVCLPPGTDMYCAPAAHLVT